MKKNVFKFIFGLMLISAILIVGCGGGGGQSVLQQESPESAVMRITESWRASGNSPSIVVDSNGNFVKYIRAGEDVEQNYQDSLYKKEISLNDLHLMIIDKEIENNKAKVICRLLAIESDSNNSSDSEHKTTDSTSITQEGEPYRSIRLAETSDGKPTSESEPSTQPSFSEDLFIIFFLEYDEGKWWLSDVEVTDKDPTITPTPDPTPGPDKEEYAEYTIKYINFTTEKIIKDRKDKGIINTKIILSDKEKELEGYSFVADKSTTDGIIDADGTLVLTLYFIPVENEKISYTVKYINSNNKETIDEKNIEGKKGQQIIIKGSNGLNIEIPGYIFVTTNPDKETIILEEEGTVISLYYEKVYTISGYLTDSKNSSNVIKNATIKFYIVDQNAEKGYSIFYDDEGRQVQIKTDDKGFYDTSKIESVVFKEGTYLLVVEAEGYESQTKKVTLPPETSSSSNIRANIYLK